VIIVDRTLARLAAEDDPIRVGMIGAGFMGHGIARQLLRYVQGMKLVAVSNRHPERAERAYRECGVESLRSVATPAELEQAIDAGVPAVTDDPTVVCRAGSVDVVLEVTGDIGFGAEVAWRSHEPVPVRARHRRVPGAVREHQGVPRSTPQSDHAEAVRGQGG
jgi:predicted homoserine dehydrogenase-like protein